jgi:hypothetical protein
MLNLKKTRENSLKKIRNNPKNRDVVEVVWSFLNNESKRLSLSSKC